MIKKTRMLGSNIFQQFITKLFNSRAKHARYFVAMVLLVFGFLVAPFSPVGLKSEKAAANHGCYLWVFQNTYYNAYQGGAAGYYPCPPAGGGHARYYLGPGLYKDISSFTFHLHCPYMTAHLSDANGLSFGGTGGLNGGMGSAWDIAELAPYGWDNRIVRIDLYNNC